MMQKLISFLFVIFYLNRAVFSSPQAATPQFNHVDVLPKSLHACRENDPGIEECTLTQIQYILGQLKTGISEINLPVMDPTEIPKVNFDFANDLVKGKVTLLDLVLTGLSDIKLKTVHRTKKGDNITLTFGGVAPKLQIKGNHRADVFFNNAKVSSKGSFELTLTDVIFKMKVEAVLYDRDGHRYMRNTKLDFDPTIGGMKLKADGILPEPTLNDAIVDFINENWTQIYQILIKESRSHWEPALLKIANNYWSYLPYDVMVIDDSN